MASFSKRKCELDQAMDSLLTIKNNIVSTEKELTELNFRMKVVQEQASNLSATLNSHMMLFKSTRKHSKIDSVTKHKIKDVEDTIKSIRVEIGLKMCHKESLLKKFRDTSATAMSIRFNVNLH